MPFRAFIAVDLPPYPAIRALVEELRASGGQLKIVDPEQLHLTLKFLGTTDEHRVPTIAEIMRESVRGLPPFRVRVIGTGAFPSMDRMNVLWVGLEPGDDLARIAAALDQRLIALGYPREKRPFSAHVTIARVRGGRNRERLHGILETHRADVFGEHRVDDIRLKRSVLTSHGPTYSTVEQTPL